MLIIFVSNKVTKYLAGLLKCISETLQKRKWGRIDSRNSLYRFILSVLLRLTRAFWVENVIVERN